MAALAGEVSKQIKGHSEGEKGFRPWWDTIEDNVLYAFVTLGLITLPMTFFSKTPIECTPHPNNWEQNITEFRGLTRFYPKTYCTETMIEPFLLYLPFTLLTVPIVLTFIEKTFVILYRVEDKMNQFYNLLVKESLASEDVAALSKENVRDCHEIEQAFKCSNDCYDSYMWRTLLEIVGGILLAIMWGLHYGINGIGVKFFDCNVYGRLFECIVPNSRFFMYVYVVSSVLIVAYLLCSIYNFVWIVSPRVGRLSVFLGGCNRQDDSYHYEESSRARIRNAPGPDVRLNLYFKKEARDFNLLINLLAESQGMPEALRILALFEHQFSMLWEAEGTRITQQHTPSMTSSVSSAEVITAPDRLRSIVVQWDDCKIADYFYRCYKKRFFLEYTVEVSPATEAPIKSIYYYNDDSSWAACEELGAFGAAGEKAALNKAKKYQLTFDGLEPGTNYKVIFSTEINGKTVAQSVRNYECTAP